MSASVVDQPTEIRSDRSASTPMAASTGEGSIASLAHELPECTAMPAWSRPSSTACGSTPVDAEAHDVRESLRCVAVERDAFHRCGGVDDAARVSRCAARASASSVTAAERATAPHPRIAGTFSKPSPTGPFLIAAEEQRAQSEPASHDERSDTGGPAHLVGADRHEVDAQLVERDEGMSGRLGRVDVQQHPAVAAQLRHLDDWLQRADLVVAPLKVHERGVGPDRGGDRVDVHLAAVVASDHRDLRGLGASRESHRASARPLARPCAAASLRGTPCRGGDRLGRPAREHDLAVSGSEELGRRRPGRPRRRLGRRGPRCASVRDQPPGVDCIHSTIASMASGRVGEVDAWSR